MNIDGTVCRMPVQQEREQLGWNDEFEQAWAVLGRPEPVGRVTRLDRGWSSVDTGHGDVLRVRNIGADVAVGDWVIVSPDGERVAAVLPRRSAFIRRASFEGSRGEAHALAANLDTVFLVHALTSPPNQRRLERELVLTYDSGADPVIVLSKADVARDERSVADAVRTVEAVALEAPVHAVSARTGVGLDVLRAYAPVGRTVGVLGASGVGKSTLVNALIGADVQRTTAVREGDHRGRHTTVATELLDLPGGGMLLDTPGLRAVSLWATGDGLAKSFSDVSALAERCRFANCSHDVEPDCAVAEAVRDGTLSEMRLVSWVRLSAELRTLATEVVEVERAAGKGRGRRGFPSR